MICIWTGDLYIRVALALPLCHRNCTCWFCSFFLLHKWANPCLVLFIFVLFLKLLKMIYWQWWWNFRIKNAKNCFKWNQISSQSTNTLVVISLARIKLALSWSEVQWEKRRGTWDPGPSSRSISSRRGPYCRWHRPK